MELLELNFAFCLACLYDGDSFSFYGNKAKRCTCENSNFWRDVRKIILTDSTTRKHNIHSLWLTLVESLGSASLTCLVHSQVFHDSKDNRNRIFSCTYSAYRYHEHSADCLNLICSSSNNFWNNSVDSSSSFSTMSTRKRSNCQWREFHGGKWKSFGIYYESFNPWP